MRLSNSARYSSFSRRTPSVAATCCASWLRSSSRSASARCPAFRPLAVCSCTRASASSARASASSARATATREVSCASLASRSASSTRAALSTSADFRDSFSDLSRWRSPSASESAPFWASRASFPAAPFCRSRSSSFSRASQLSRRAAASLRSASSSGPIFSNSRAPSLSRTCSCAPRSPTWASRLEQDDSRSSSSPRSSLDSASARSRFPRSSAISSRAPSPSCSSCPRVFTRPSHSDDFRESSSASRCTWPSRSFACRSSPSSSRSFSLVAAALSRSPCSCSSCVD